jgi:carbonic anhydrase/acetyltransferase-like protein (isoleucine patch superfamily)
MLVEHRGRRPTVHPEAYVAPNAVISGDVEIGHHTSVLFGAVITAEGGPVRIGAECVIMEHAVIRGSGHHPVHIGNHVLVGPHAHLTGCTIEDEVFVATGASVFNGATLGRGSEVRINGVVHVNSALAANATVPIGWVAVGRPASLFPPERHEDIWPIQKSMDFRGTVWGADPTASRARIISRYARSLEEHHRDDRRLDV